MDMQEIRQFFSYLAHLGHITLDNARQLADHCIQNDIRDLHRIFDNLLKYNILTAEAVEIVAQQWEGSKTPKSPVYDQDLHRSVNPDAHYLGPYQVVRELGKGGMGAVYQVIHRDLPGRTFALKIVIPECVDVESLARFRREARVLSALQHPGIVGVIHANMNDLPHYLVMDFVQGDTLNKSERVAGLTFMQRLGLFVKIVEAVAYAHSKDIIHRDLKPANIMIDVGGSPRIMDFGLAKSSGGMTDDMRRQIETLSDVSKTQSGELIGTPAYFAPEHIRGEKITAGSDVFALGLIVYELLTNFEQRLINGGSTIVDHISELSHFQGGHKAFVRILRDAPLDSDMKTYLETILSRCVEPNMNERYQSATDLFDDLNQFFGELRGQEDEQRRSVVTLKSQKKRLILLGASSFLFGLIGMLGFILESDRARSEVQSRKSEEEKRKLAEEVILREKTLNEQQRLRIEAEINSAELAQKRAEEIELAKKKDELIHDADRCLYQALSAEADSDWENAIRLLKKSLDLNPASFQARMLIGHCRFSLQDPVCVDDFALAAQMDGLSVSQKAEAEFWQIFSGVNLNHLIGQVRSAELLNQVNTMSQDKQYSLLGKAFRDILSLESRGVLSDSSLKPLSIIPEEFSDHWLTLYLKGMVYSHQNPSQALLCFGSSMARNPGFPMSFYHHARVSIELGKYELALQSLERLRLLMPGWNVSEITRARVLLELAVQESGQVTFELCSRAMNIIGQVDSWKGGKQAAFDLYGVQIFMLAAKANALQYRVIKDQDPKNAATLRQRSLTYLQKLADMTLPDYQQEEVNRIKLLLN